MEKVDNTDVDNTATKIWNDKLKTAIENSNLDEVKRALSQGADANDKTRFGPYVDGFIGLAIIKVNGKDRDVFVYSVDGWKIKTIAAETKDETAKKKAKQIITILLDYGADLSNQHPAVLRDDVDILQECTEHLTPEKQWKVLHQFIQGLTKCGEYGIDRKKIKKIKCSFPEIKDKIIEDFVDKLKNPEYVSNLRDMELIQDVHSEFPRDPKVNKLYLDLTSSTITKITLPTISAIVNKDESLSQPHKIMQKLITTPELTSHVLSYFDPQDIGSLLATIHPEERLINLYEQLEKVRPEAKSFIESLIRPITKPIIDEVKKDLKLKLDTTATTPKDLRTAEIAMEFDTKLWELSHELKKLHLKDLVPTDELQA